MKIETSSTGIFRPGWLERASVLPVYAALASTWILIWFSGLVEVSYESRLMTVLLNTMVVASASAAGAWLAVRGYLANGLPEMLYAGCGLIAMGSCHLVSSLIIGGAQGPNDAVTVHNLGVFCAAWLHLAAALHAGRPKPSRPDPSALKAACACSAALALIGLFWTAARYDLSPVFYVTGKGTTPVRQLVLMLSIALLAVAAAFLIRHADQREQPDATLLRPGPYPHRHRIGRCVDRGARKRSQLVRTPGPKLRLRLSPGSFHRGHPHGGSKRTGCEGSGHRLLSRIRKPLSGPGRARCARR